MREKREFVNFRSYWLLLGILSLLLTAGMGFSRGNAKPVALPFVDGNSTPVYMEVMPADVNRNLDDPGDVVNFADALTAGASYLVQFQADITDDNAGNGFNGSETPEDPDDGGWDWSLNWDTDLHAHSTNASPPNIYGATVQGIYRAYLADNDAAYFTAMTDAADYMIGDAGIRSGADLKFLMLYNDLPGVSGTAYADSARAKYDARIATYVTATAFAEYIRDVRGVTQNYPNGIIAWDIGIWAVDAQMLHDRYPGNGYDSDADDIAEVIYQDSFNDNPGLFDVVDDAGWDPTGADRNFWWYTIGITGLIDAFDATDSHTGEIPGLITRLQDSQYSNGAFSDSYGANADNEDWQDTAYIILTLANYDASTYATEITDGAYWLGATQHAGGGWVYGSGNHYPEVGGEATAALSFGSNPSEVWVDDDWTSQAAVDADNPVDGNYLVWGLNAFSNIQDAIDAVSGSTINLLPGTYYGAIQINTVGLKLIGAGEGVVTIDVTGTAFNGAGIYVNADDVVLEGFTLLSNGSNPPRYGIKVADVDSDTLRHVTVQNIYRSGVDCLGSSNLTILDVTSQNNGGHGLSLVDCNGAHVTDVTFSGNGWQNVSVATWGNYTPLGTSGIVFDGTNAFGDLFQLEMGDFNNPGVPPAGPAIITYSTNILDGADVTVQASDFGFALHGDQNDSPDQVRIWFFSTLANAAIVPPLAPIGHWTGSAMYIESLTDSSQVYVTPGCSIQAAVDNVSGSTVNISAGIYTGQVKMSGFTNLNLIGAGVGATIIKAPAIAMPEFFSTSYDNYPILFCDNSTVNISDLTVDGDGKGNINYRFIGVGFWNSSGSLTDCRVTGVRDTPFSGAQHGVGVYAYNNSGGPYTISITDVDVDNYQKNAFALNGNDNLTVNLLRVTTIGAGPTTVTAQNGIQLWGAGGSIIDCDVSGNAWIWTSGTHWSAAGYLMYAAGTVTITNSDAADNQVSFNYYDTDGSITGGTIVSTTGTPDYTSGVDVSTTSGARSSGRDIMPQPMIEEYAGQVQRNQNALDADETVSISGVTMTGPGTAESYGVYAWGTGDNLDLEVDGCDISSHEYGVYVQEDGGTISPADITGNSLSNTNNGWDNATAHNWDSNCYSDFPLNSGFPTQYDVAGGGGNADLNPNTNDCGNIDFVLTDDYIGCIDPCDELDYLYVTFDQAAYITGQMFIQLPANLDAAWPAGTAFNDVFPGTNVAPNLSFAAGRRTATPGEIELNVSWALPYSDGDGTKYIACIPLVNTGAVDDNVLVISGTSSTFFDAGGAHIDEFFFGVATITVDCEAPVASAAYDPALTCDAFGSADDLEDAITATVLRGTAPNSALVEGWVDVNGDLYTLFNTTLGGDFVGTFPSAADKAAFFTSLTEGCNDIFVYGLDAECNEGVSAAFNVAKDTTPPALTVINTTPGSPFCYFDNAGGSQYGGDLLDDYLDITTDLQELLSAGCFAQTGDLTISLGAETYVVALDLAGYPVDDTEALALWTWMMGIPAVASANGDPITFDVTATDCAGNTSAVEQFTICIDVTDPLNTLTDFDARPTDMGVWLDWSWTYDVSQATDLEIYRSPDSFEYPTYPSQLWSDLSSAADYPQTRADAITAGWALVTSQDGSVATTSGAHAGSHPSADTDYWLDADASWVDESEDRDIYRYVTFIQDAGGNWSPNPSGYSLNVNADRSTNYWLGDYTRDDQVDPNSSSGRVHGPDLILLSGVYFTTVIPATEFYDIGPENAENSIGKGIPAPDGSIDFLDLVPFSFNFGTTSPIGGLEEFDVELPAVPVAFNSLDDLPGLELSYLSEYPQSVGDEFTVSVMLSGNDYGAVKVAEGVVTFDPEVVGFVSVNPGEITVADGTPWIAARELTTEEGSVGIACAAMGQTSTILGNATVATITFELLTTEHPASKIQITDIRFADGMARRINGADGFLSIAEGGFLPTSYALHQNFPNPFNPSTHIRFDVPEAVDVQIDIYNVLGRHVRALTSGLMSAGSYDILWDGTDAQGQAVTTGVYVYRMRAGDFVSSRKMMLTR